MPYWQRCTAFAEARSLANLPRAPVRRPQRAGVTRADRTVRWCPAGARAAVHGRRARWPRSRNASLLAVRRHRSQAVERLAAAGHVERRVVRFAEQHARNRSAPSSFRVWIGGIERDAGMPACAGCRGGSATPPMPPGPRLAARSM